MSINCSVFQSLVGWMQHRCQAWPEIQNCYSSTSDPGTEAAAVLFNHSSFTNVGDPPPHPPQHHQMNWRTPPPTIPLNMKWKTPSSTNIPKSEGPAGNSKYQFCCTKALKHFTQLCFPSKQKFQLWQSHIERKRLDAGDIWPWLKFYHVLLREPHDTVNAMMEVLRIVENMWTRRLWEGIRWWATHRTSRRRKIIDIMNTSYQFFLLKTNK